ncbi:MAG: phosphotransferase [Acidimicrobiales bacterium]
MRAVYDPEGVTAEWLTEVLASAGAVSDRRVTSFSSEPIGTGQVGCNMRYLLEYDRPGPGPLTVVGKFASRDETSRSTGVQTKTYETEVAFYRDIAGTVEVARPHCFFAEVETGTPDVVLVLEDLAPADPGDQISGCTPDQAELAVREAARLHGPRWGDPTLLEVPWLADKAAGDGALVGLFAMIWPSFVDRYRDRLAPESLQVGERMVAHGRSWGEPDPPALTVCHSDYRLDNLLFGPAGSSRPIAVVDWQTVRLNVGTSDVSYFLGAAMAPELRRRHEKDLVARYHETLSAYDIGDYGFDRCWEDYRRHTFGGFFMAVFASMVVERTERGDAMFMAMANGAATHVTDLGALEFLA